LVPLQHVATCWQSPNTGCLCTLFCWSYAYYAAEHSHHACILIPISEVNLSHTFPKCVGKFPSGLINPWDWEYFENAWVVGLGMCSVSTNSIYLNVHNCWHSFCIVATTGGLYMSLHASIPYNVNGNTWECQGVRCCSSTYALVHAQEPKR
jgi:hypothetical protein